LKKLDENILNQLIKWHGRFWGKERFYAKEMNQS